MMSIYDTPSGRARRWGTRRSSQRSMPAYARVVVIVLAALLAGTFLWQSAQRILHPPQKNPVAAAAGPAAPSWQSESLSELDAGVRDAGDGNIIPAEVDVDRAASVIAASRAQSEPAGAEFFASAIGKLDRVGAAHPDNARLIEHVTLARIELAQLRTVQLVGTDPAGSATAAAAAEAEHEPPAGPGVHARHSVEIPGHVVIASPHQIAAGQTLDPKTLGGNYLDATLMPDTSEMILPPYTRAFADNVRVENLTMEGASQTLDGIHWKDVTFIGTRLRYESGELDLQNARFVRCTFGFTTDERGARIATAIALGQPSITIQ
jgi:hypothetical protein